MQHSSVVDANKVVQSLRAGRIEGRCTGVKGKMG